VLAQLEAVGGIYVAMFVIALISGVFPLVNSEVMVGVVAVTIDSLPKVLTIAVIVAVGQSITHTVLFFSARGLATATAGRREKLQEKIAKARALAERWGNKWFLLISVAALLGFPPMILVALAAGALGVRYRMFIAIDVAGRIVRFIAIALAASYF
jgi:membrane protein YqaA with SNARE-associated domain